MSVKADWLLVKTEDQEVVLQFQLVSDYSKSTGVLVQLRRKTNFAGAVRENIANGLEKVSTIKFGQ